MCNRVVCTLAALAVVLVLVPFLGVFGMMGVGWMGGGMMMGMSLFGILWLLVAVVVLAALVVMVFGETRKT